MKMLFLTTRPPYPPIGGDRLRPFYFIKHLALNWEITILSFSESPREEKLLKSHPLEKVKIHTVNLPRFKSYLQAAGGLFSRKPLEFAYYADRKMRELIQKELKGGGYDLIFCHLVRMAPYVENIKGIKKVLDLCDALSLRYQISSRHRKGPFKFIEWLESRRLKEYEPRVTHKFDLNLISSFTDKIYLEQDLGVQRLKVAELGVSPDELKYRETRIDPKKIIFFANLRTFHNVDAVKYFYKKIFSLIKEKISDARFVIVGANVPRCILQMRKDRSVNVFNDVPAIRPFIEDACVSVAPMRVSVGIQDKILQSMAYRIPVITTTLGLGGIRAEADKEILVADTPEEFAKKVVMLMQDDNLRSRIIDNAYQLIKEQYLWPDICDRLNRELIALLER